MKYEWIILLRQPLIKLALVTCFLLSSIALNNGWQHISNVQTKITQARQAEQTRFAAQIKEFSEGGKAGEAGYYLFHTVYDKPSIWSFLSLGNRPYSPTLQRINLLGLQSQIYGGESHNPEYVVAGSFDFSFVVVFLLPILCIALAHDVYIAERTSGRLDILRTMSRTPLIFWLKRITLRWLIACFIVLTPLFLLAASQSLPFIGLVKVSLVCGLYAWFWILLAGLLSFRRSNASAAANATLCMTLWLAITLLLPTAANVLIKKFIPVISGSEIALEHRKKVNDAWDLPKTATFEPFFKRYPEWKDTPPVFTRFHWKWYYAFHHVADLQLESKILARNQSLLKRDVISQQLGLALPSVAVQNWFDDFSDNNLMHVLHQRGNIQDFHTKLRHYFYPYFFNEIPFYEKDFLDMPKYNAINHAH